MSTASPLLETLRREFQAPRRGIVGLVDDVLAACRERDLQIDWHAGRCRVQLQGGESDEAGDVPLRKSAFRAMLARVAVLCNQRHPNSVSPFGGEGELTDAADPPMVFRVVFANTPDEQRLALTRSAAGLPGLSSSIRRSVGMPVVVPLPVTENGRGQPGAASPRPAWMQWRRLQASVVAAAVLLVLGGIAWVIKSQRDDIHQLVTERDQARAELDQFRPQSGAQDGPKPEFPLRYTANPADRPLNWPTTLNQLYNRDKAARFNLGELEKLGGESVRAEIARMRQHDPAVTPEEMLGEIFRAWGRPAMP